MRLPHFLIFLFLFSGTEVIAQREAANWFFGDFAGLNFNSGFPVSRNDGRLQTVEGSATISDRNGNLLFYTDGITVYDRQHNVMPYGQNLKGNVSSTQSAIIVPKPASPGIYYIFTVDKPDYFRISDDPIEGVNYSVVDMSLNSGFGDIVPGMKNIHLVTYDPSDPRESEYKSSEKISAVLHGDGSSYWVVTQFMNRFYSFKVTAGGVETTPVISTTPHSAPPLFNDEQVNITAIGYMKISPNGKKLAAAYSSTTLGSPRTGTKRSGKVFLYDFNDLTGKVTNEQIILLDSYPYGVEFSPKTTKLYVTANIYNEQDIVLRSELYQYDLESSNIYNSQKILHTSNNVTGALQLAMDGRIYRAGYPIFAQNHPFLSVIKNPEAMGNSAGYDHNAVSVAPNGVRLGLPPFIQSFFLNNFAFEELCFGDETHFFITTDEPYTSVLWDFGDNTTSSSPDAYHTYSSPGTYVVSFTRFLNGEAFEPSKKELTIVEIPAVEERIELVQCDTDNNATDGIALFNLQEAKEAVTLGNANTQVFFYENHAAAIADERNQNSLNSFYTNTSRDQVVFAKVTGFNSECSAISEVVLKTKSSIEINPSPVGGCDLGEGEATFNFDTIEADILAELGLPADIELTFHETRNDAGSGVNPLPSNYVSGPRTVYIRAQSEGICYGAGAVELETTSFPNLQASYEIQACSKDFPMTLGSDIIIGENGNYGFRWSTGETSREIIITEGGNYFVEVINEKLGCGKMIEYSIEELLTPEIVQVEVNSSGETSELTVIPNFEEGNLYAIDNIEGPYQQDPVFRGIPGGPHTLFLKNNYSCEISQQEVLVFGFPGFFTPNNDGFNDKWKPFKIDDPAYRIDRIHVFDRYGKLLKELNPDGPGWDGNYNNRSMPEDDYWFIIILENGRDFKGHFSLRRS